MPRGRGAQFLRVFQALGLDVRKQAAKFFPFGAPGGDGVVAGQQQAQILFESTVDRVQKGDCQHFRSRLTRRNAARESIL